MRALAAGLGFGTAFVLASGFIGLLLAATAQRGVLFIIAAATVLFVVVFAVRCRSGIDATCFAAGTAVGLPLGFTFGGWLLAQAVFMPARWVFWSPLALAAGLVPTAAVTAILAHVVFVRRANAATQSNHEDEAASEGSDTRRS